MYLIYRDSIEEKHFSMLSSRHFAIHLLLLHLHFIVILALQSCDLQKLMPRTLLHNHLSVLWDWVIQIVVYH